VELIARAIIVTVITVLGWQMLAGWTGTRAVEQAEGCKVSYVYDGDTVALDCGDGVEETARIQGLDTPETKEPGCADELALGSLATDRLRSLIAGGEVRLRLFGEDRYGRLLIRMDVDGEDVATTMIREGLAVPYDGGARPDWCERLRDL